MPAAGGDDFAELGAVAVQQPERAVALGLVVDVDGELVAGQAGGDPADVDRLEVVAGHLPHMAAGGVGDRDGLGAAERHGDAPVFRAFPAVQDARAVEVALVQRDRVGKVAPAQRAVVVEHGVAGDDLVAAVAVEVDGQRLVGGAAAAGLGYGPQQFPGAVVGPDPVVAVLGEHIGGPACAGEVAEDQAVAGVAFHRDAPLLASGAPVEFHDCGGVGHDDLGVAVAVPVVDLAGDIVVP